MTNPGPINPPTKNPKYNVFLGLTLLAMTATFATIMMVDGNERWLALVPAALFVVLVVKVVQISFAMEKASSEAQ